MRCCCRESEVVEFQKENEGGGGRLTLTISMHQVSNSKLIYIYELVNTIPVYVMFVY